MRDIVGYIKKFEDTFSKSAKLIARYIEAYPDTILDLSTSELAEKTGTSAASVVRFCRTIGCKGFLDFKNQMERDFLYVVEQEQQIMQTDNVSTIKNKIIQYSISLFDEFRSAIDVDDLEEAADAVVKAKRVILIAEGGSASMADCARINLINAGVYCTLETDASIQIMTAEYASPEDVVIGITHSGRIRSTIDALEIAKKRGATTIAITGSHSAPICEYADIILACDVHHQYDLSDFQGSRLEEFTIMSILQIVVLFKSYGDAAFVSGRVRSSVEEKRRIKS